MKLFLAVSMSEELSAGSSPTINICVFSTEEKRQEFINDWIKDHQHYEKSETDDLLYFNQGWAYNLDVHEKQLDTHSQYNHILKQY